MLTNVVLFLYITLNHLLSGKYYVTGLQQVHMHSTHNFYVLRLCNW